MVSLPRARSIASTLATSGNVPEEYKLKANAEQLTLDRLRLVEWLKTAAQTRRSTVQARHWHEAAHELEVAIRAAAEDADTR